MDAERFLSDIISTLSAPTDFRTSIDGLAQLATRSGLADWCGIFMFENGESVCRLATAPSSQGETVFSVGSRERSGPAHVRRTGEPQLIIDPAVEIADGLGMAPEDLILPGGRWPTIYSCVPAVAGNKTIGAVAFLLGSPRQRFSDSERSLATSLARAVAAAIDNSRLHREAHEANRLKDEFVAMVSHELRTQLTPILGCIHLLRTTNLSTTNFERALEMIERSAKTQVQIVDDLLDVSRMVAGKLHLSIKSTTVVPVVEAAIGTVKSSADAKGVKLITNFEAVDASLDADPYRLQQIIWNLLSNAVKFTPPGGSVEVSVSSQATHVQIQVTDTGVGIAANFLPYIFDAFRQGNDQGPELKSGLGLGLAIVRRLAELHNGSIQATSSGEGKGSVFTLRLPASSRSAAVATAGSEGA